MCMTNHNETPTVDVETMLETERLNAHLGAVADHILFGEAAPSLAGDSLYDTVWALRVLDTELAGIWTDDSSEDAALRIAELEREVGVRIDAMNQHPSSRRLEGLGSVLLEIASPEMPPLRPISGIAQSELDWHGTTAL